MEAIEQRALKYVGLLMEDEFEHIAQISHYNYNYYVGQDKELLLGISDDDNTTIWYLCKNKEFLPFGYSFTSENDEFHQGILT